MKIHVREVNGAVRMDLVGESKRERRQIQAFVAAINGRMPGSSAEIRYDRLLDAALRVESVGFAEDGTVDSVAIEGRLAT